MGEEIWDRIDYAAEVGCANLVLNSNGGLLLRLNHIDRILRSPLKRFILSLDGYTKETYEKIRYLGKWEETYAGVEELLRRKEASGGEFPAIICQFSLMAENEHEVEPFRKYWQDRGAEVKVRPSLNGRRADRFAPTGSTTRQLSASHAHGAITRWPSIRTAASSPALSTMRECSRPATPTTCRCASYGLFSERSCGVRIANIVGATSPRSAKGAGTGRPPARNMRKRMRRERGRSGMTRRLPTSGSVGTIFQASSRCNMTEAALSESLVAPRGKASQPTHVQEEYGLRPEAAEFPMMLVLSFVYPCNAECPHCPLYEFEYPRHL